MLTRRRRLAACALLAVPVASLTLAAQVTFEAAIADLRHPDVAARLRAIRLLKPAAFPESAVPLASVVIDPVDDVQLEAIAAELNIFLADRVVANERRVLVVAPRKKISAEEIFSIGPLELNTNPVPPE